MSLQSQMIVLALSVPMVSLLRYRVRPIYLGTFASGPAVRADRMLGE
jgi:hypothetical protein